MSFRSDSLFHRLTEPQRDELMIAIMECPPKLDRFNFGLDLCRKWDVKASRTGVHDFFKRYNFGWRLERGAWAAKSTEGMSNYAEEQRKLVAQKLFAEASDADADPKFLLFLRGLELEQEKLALRERMALSRGKLEKEKLELSERKVKLLEEKSAKAKAQLENIAKKSKGGLSAETRKQIEEAAGLL